MATPSWTAADQSALDALNKKRQEYEEAIRKPIDALAGKMLSYNMSESELAREIIDNADELHAALEPFLIPKTKDAS